MLRQEGRRLLLALVYWGKEMMHVSRDNIAIVTFMKTSGHL